MSIRHYRNKRNMNAFISLLKVLCIPYLVFILAINLTSHTNALFTDQEESTVDIVAADLFVEIFNQVELDEKVNLSDETESLDEKGPSKDGEKNEENQSKDMTNGQNENKQEKKSTVPQENNETITDEKTDKDEIDDDHSEVKDDSATDDGDEDEE